jgi:transcription antitermination factor NusG
MAWYAVHTKSRHEYKTNSGLAQKNLATFLPEIEVWSKRKDRKKKIVIPLFPGYLFVETPLLDNETKLAILKTFGVVRILGKKENTEPLPVPESKILALKRLLDKKVEMFTIQYPKAGEPARIIDGPFAGIEGMVIQSDLEKELFVISIELLQRSVAIKLEGFQIGKIE